MAKDSKVDRPEGKRAARPKNEETRSSIEFTKNPKPGRKSKSRDWFRV